MKNELRHQLLRQRIAQSTDDARSKSRMIEDELIAYLHSFNFQAMCIYESIEALGEVHTPNLIKRIMNEFPQVGLTKVEPVKDATIPSGRFDVIVVPILGFDYECNRIGMGGGWYDKFLSAQPRAKKIGLAFEIARRDHIPIDNTDVALDLIITETSH